MLKDALQGGGGNWLKMQQLINELNDIYGLSPKADFFCVFGQIAADLIGQNRLGNNLQARNTVKFNSQQLEADYIRFLLSHQDTFAMMTRRPNKPASRNNRMSFYRARMLA
ncbi:Oidioi.mRNA.OKI2018_I69.chr2.g5282.t1.cds [Oikopleura dioica]|uniref:Oidioi.mRNA.OKI2018_I69.chr2.g5282.t1.cds n=1 Tax=Oikopleura dioica TaxID=34765 RepID=A0ABN7SZG7_OIKDI|nr:Oidioi.mRNA.OKI2018_I69.chr2.g5282.t1.cds [Oikopleura dioica]